LRIITDGKRGADIVSRIPGLAKKAPAQRQRLEINEVVLQVIGLTRSETSNNGILVQTRVTDGLLRLWGDRVQLQQVILNLDHKRHRSDELARRGIARVADRYQHGRAALYFA
jgi:C4-dicarboxylate-specific signal transduction histidine kinase